MYILYLQKLAVVRASEEVTLHLIKSKCLPVVLYGLEACSLTKSNLQALRLCH